MNHLFKHLFKTIRNLFPCSIRPRTISTPPHCGGYGRGWAAFFLLLLSLTLHAQGLEVVTPSAVGLDASRLANADSAIFRAIEAKNVPGAVLCVVRHGKIGYLKAYGNKRVYPKTEPMTTETVFDLASCSKALSTATCAMMLVDRGRLRLLDAVSMYIPGFENWRDSTTGDTETIRVMNLITHTSGLPPYAPVAELQKKHGAPNQDAVIDWISHCQRGWAPGEGWRYSCLNFITLQRVIETVSGQTLDRFAHDNLFAPLGMTHTTYRPSKELARLCAPTERQKDGNCLLGEVHDPLARIMMGGVSGNAGVFSSAEDIATFCAMILNGGEWNGRRILSKKAVECLESVPRSLEKWGHTPGWNMYTPYSSNAGDLVSPHALSHTGYTGTLIVIDPDNDIAVILLTNCVHPDDKGNTVRLRGLVTNAVLASILD